MPAQPPAYYRARLSAIAREIKSETDDKRIRLLQNGYFPDFQPSSASRPSAEDNRPLTFLELCSWDTWFAMYPEKVCGTIKIMTSRSFPLAVYGTAYDVIKTVKSGIEAAQNRIRLAKAKLKMLNLNF